MPGSVTSSKILHAQARKSMVVILLSIIDLHSFLYTANTWSIWLNYTIRKLTDAVCVIVTLLSNKQRM